MGYVMRIKSIRLENFKNVVDGTVEMPLGSSNMDTVPEVGADILGIYGQNGSGKTAIINALGVLKCLMKGNSLPEDAVHYIMAEAEELTITLGFFIENLSVRLLGGYKALGEYQVTLRRNEEFKIQISHECIKMRVKQGSVAVKRHTVIEYLADDEKFAFKPATLFNKACQLDEKIKLNLWVAKRLAMRERKSYIFSKEFSEAYIKPKRENGDWSDTTFILTFLKYYACFHLHVIENNSSANAGNTIIIPLTPPNTTDVLIYDDSQILLRKQQIVPEWRYAQVVRWIEETNLVLCTIVPGLTVGIYDFGKELMKNGEEGRRFQFLSRRGEVEIPLKYESDGINKLISILCLLMLVYNNSTTCLAVDELDAGIFEYLLGELLSVFEKGAKGQLIFTSHNLRPLEMIDKKSIVFSTANPINRYIRLKGVMQNNNLRDLYLRSILLGGQDEEVYAETDSVEIARAFRRAGKRMNDEQKD